MANIRFPNIFDAANTKVNTVSGDAAIRQSLKCVLLTNIGELMGDPDFGSELKSCLFEIQSPLVQTLMKSCITETANKYVPELHISSVEINVTSDSTQLYILIYYTNVTTGYADILELNVLSNGELVTH